MDSAAECVAAAKVALETVDGMANDGSLFHAFWWTAYVTFCAVAVIYVWEIQQNSSPDSADMPSLGQLSGLADRCLKHLDRATSVNSPNRRYSVVLEELRLEARRQSSTTRNDPGQTLGRPVDNEAQGAFDNCPGDAVQDQSALVDNTASGQVLQDPVDGDSLYPMQDLWNGWQTTDWLDLDSSVRSLVSLLVLFDLANTSRRLLASFQIQMALLASGTFLEAEPPYSYHPVVYRCETSHCRSLTTPPGLQHGSSRTPTCCS